jgi:serine phosphatase RsbU (regulator of sigma subunit)
VTRPTALHDGDEIEVGTTKLTFALGSDVSKSFVAVSPRAQGDRPDVLLSISAQMTTSALVLQGAQGEAARAVEKRLQVLSDVGAAIARTLDEESLLATVLDKLFGVFPQAERGVVLLSVPGELLPKPRLALTRSGEPAEIRLSGTLLHEVVEHKRAVLSVDAQRDDRLALAVSVRDFDLRSVVCVPVVAEGQVLGVIQLDGEPRAKAFEKSDVALLLGIAGQVALALSVARLHRKVVEQELLQQDLELARRIQRRFLPVEPPRVAGLVCAVEFHPAFEVGGDYFGFFELAAGRFAVAVGDVAGKGVSAALYMARLASELRFATAGLTEPSEILVRLNRALLLGAEEGMFATLACLVFEPITGRVTVANAGHLAPIVLEDSGGLAVLESPQAPPLGIDERGVFPAATYDLEDGDAVLLYSDGVSEALNSRGDLFGEKRLRTAVCAGLGDPERLTHRVLAAVRDFAGTAPQADDITILAVRRGSPPRRILGGDETLTKR